jgi:hypothetical protein
MSLDREYFYELVDKIPEAKLSELRKTLLIMAMPEEEATEEELAAIQEGKKEFANGEFHTYESIDDLRRDLRSEES